MIKYNTTGILGDGDGVIRNTQGAICALLVGMSEENIRDFLEKNPGTYISTMHWNDETGMME